MSADGLAAARRDRALLDLADLDRQVDGGELTVTEAAPLRRRYERAAADAIAELAAPSERQAADEPDEPAPSRRRRTRLGYGLAAALAVLAAAVLLLPGSVGDRPPGGAVTGNEVRGAATPEPVPSAGPGRDLSKVSDAEMEAVITDNPDVLGMRLALAQRYTDKGRYDKAVTQYLAVLRRDPGNAVAQAHLGWVVFQLGRTQEALALVERALQAEPAMLRARWFKANILLYGQSDPGGAIDVLRGMEREQLTTEVRKQVTDLIGVARARQAGG